MRQDTTCDDREAEASRRLAEAFDPAVIDSLLADAKAADTPLDGAEGLLSQMTKAVLERALQAEMTHELGYEYGDPAGAGSGNSRNGSSTKTVSTANGPVTIQVPRDRNGAFEPKIVPKRARRLPQIEEMVLSLYARGLSTRDIAAHLLEVYGVKASRELVSNVTDVVADEVESWRARPVDEVYPIVYARRHPDQGPRQGRGGGEGRSPGHRHRRGGGASTPWACGVAEGRGGEVLALGADPAAATGACGTSSSPAATA